MNVMWNGKSGFIGKVGESWK